MCVCVHIQNKINQVSGKHLYCGQICTVAMQLSGWLRESTKKFLGSVDHVQKTVTVFFRIVNLSQSS